MNIGAKCPLCNKELPKNVTNLKNYAYSLRDESGKIVGMCSWSCYKKYKASRILKMKIITEEEANWLKYARVPMPEGVRIKAPWFMRYKYY